MSERTALLSISETIVQQRSDTVTFTAHVRSLDRPPIPVLTELQYRISDPYAVRMSLGPPSGPRVPWVFARELLSNGLQHATGSGDVLVMPAQGHHPDALHVILKNGPRTAVIELGATEVSDFLRRTFSLVPAGTESAHLNWDGITSLFGPIPRP
ncbi:SsgA family sporulation/cell division regulator [Streptomyces sp. VRA16 Mangrove soil]|uniref:SsgA family sporulation/cell division regulator n=1 Tax=Streptomyces sp. VRA16 Mangrove soil TaxID=2817434 RepID=UPI001A9FB5E9|nr:SsgA family sporulation/cell division regulator [Streptomyces sp. VRA16 Mangrove soil]MBO1332672.1 SsgA family sporulation/cell division regulator [Streptomyces sp. VRA16 Mangrove soil]